MPNSGFKFPDGFLWGAATSAHQVEGNNKNDWTEWESSPARVADLVGRGLNPGDYISGDACDHYRRFKSDFDIAKQLGHNAHRFSIEWSRIEPEEGKFNEREIEHYREVIKALRERGMEPFVTLWHWTLPLWFRDRGGWADKRSVEYFTRYAARMAQSFPEVKLWITLNETNIYTAHGYWKVNWPPHQKSLFKYLVANHHLSLAHRKAYQSIKQYNPKALVGVTQFIVYFQGTLAFIKRWFWNNFFLRSLGPYQDFIGVDYYISDRTTKERSEFLNWPIDPEGLEYVLRDIARFRKPIYITENGIADAHDEKRRKFITSHLVAVAKTINKGTNVRGYLYWSLLDNFEWDKGFNPRFGLVGVDYKTQERKIRPSAWAYKEVIERGLPAEVP